MALFVLSFVESSALQLNAPTSTDIEAGMQAGLRLFLAAGNGRVTATWVGPQARIVRSTVVGSLTQGFVTQATNIVDLQAPGVDDLSHLASLLADVVRGSLVGDWQSLVFPYVAGVNGALSWWQCANATSGPADCASVTQTRDNFLELLARLLASPEAPMGPTTPGVNTPPTLGGGVGGVVDRITSAGWMLVAVIGVVGATVVAVEIVNTRNDRRAA